MSISAKPYIREISLQAGGEVDLDSYPFTIPAISNMGTIVPHANVTFFVGENGSGKSTLLEAIAVAFGLPAEGGCRDVSRQQQDVSALHRHLKLVKSEPGSFSSIRTASGRSRMRTPSTLPSHATSSTTTSAGCSNCWPTMKHELHYPGAYSGAA